MKTHPRLTLSFATLFILTMAIGCPDEDTTNPERPPTSASAIETWLDEGYFQDWRKEPAVHPSDGPHGVVRSYFNASLTSSLAAEAALHDVDAASVKELFESDGETLEGYAVMVKVTDGDSGDDWYWYERIGTRIVADGTGASGCTGCHSAGVDFVRSALPAE